MVCINSFTPIGTELYFISQNVSSAFVLFNFKMFFFPLHRVAYGSKAHVLNMFLYLLGLLPLTNLIVTLRPSVNTTEAGELNIIMVPTSFTEVACSIS